MFKNKGEDGSLNICGTQIAKIRKGLGQRTSQRLLAEKLQLAGLDVSKNTIQQIEQGTRFVTDIELYAISKLLGVPMEELTKQQPK